MTEAEVLARFDFSGPDAVLVDCSRGRRCDGGDGLEWRVTYVAETRAAGLVLNSVVTVAIDDGTGEVLWTHAG